MSDNIVKRYATENYVTNAALPLAGGTMTGAIILPGAPTENLHAATKKYVDDNKYIHPSTHPASMITGLAEAINELGFNRVGYGSYTGDGAGYSYREQSTSIGGSSPSVTYENIMTNARSITMPFTPEMVILVCDTYTIKVVQGEYAVVTKSGTYNNQSFTATAAVAYLSGTTLQVVATLRESKNAYRSISSGVNESGILYHWIAF